jgi:RimJ/RimL family protein N-acetyltransferase
VVKNFHILIFSKDRALQLEATLRSIHLVIQDARDASMTVLFTTSADRYAAQYRYLMELFPQVTFVEQKNFQEDVWRILLGEHEAKKSAWINFFSRLNRHRLVGVYSFSEILIRLLLKFGLKWGKLPIGDLWESHYWLFSVDDCIFVKPFAFYQIVDAMEKIPKSIGFSLRLGTNTSYCYMKDAAQIQPNFRHLNENILYFEWEHAEYDFGYPLEISSSIYRASTLLPLILISYFTTPNMLESKLASNSRWYARRFPYLLCFKSSVAFSIPLNKVQSDRPLNRFSANPRYSPETLATIFDEGKRIDLRPFMNFTPISCHQEVELSFVSVDHG